MNTSYHLTHPQTGRITVMAFLSPDFVTTDDPNLWLINRIAVARGTPLRQGWGTKLMTVLCSVADAEGVTLWLGVDPDNPDWFGRLVHWYARHGFAPDSDEIDPEHNVMTRQPR